MRVTHVINGLGMGGAETALYKLISATRAEGLTHSVVSLTERYTEGGDIFGARLRAEGIPVTTLGMRQGVPDPVALARLVRLLRRDRPDIVQSWMYHADLLAGLAAGMARVPVVWGIRHSDVDRRNTKWLTHLTRVLCARMSSVVPARIICVGESVIRAHARLGYCRERMVMIPNGFDLERFTVRPEARARVRDELAIPADAPVVALLARFHPDKDHRNFMSAAHRVAREQPRVVFLLGGRGIDASNDALARMIDELQLRPHVRLLGLIPDVRDVLSAIDLLALSSRTEAFPNVLGEAMACGVPCVATDCGESRDIVGATGRIVPPQDPAALAEAMLELLALPAPARAALGRAARDHVHERYEMRAVARRYIALYADVRDRTSTGRRRKVMS